MVDMSSIVIFGKKGIICKKTHILYKYKEPILTIQDVTFQSRKGKKFNFLSEIWSYVINGKIPTLYSLCSAKVFQQCCSGDNCCECENISWNDKNDDDTWQETTGNYYEIIWSMIKNVLKDIKLGTTRVFLPLSKPYKIDLQEYDDDTWVSVSSDKDNTSKAQGLNQLFAFDDYYDKVDMPHEKNIKKLNLPRIIKEYLIVTVPCTFRYEKYDDDKDNIPWILKLYPLDQKKN